MLTCLCTHGMLIFFCDVMLAAKGEMSGLGSTTKNLKMATCKRRTKEDRWASSLRHISTFESTVRRIVGYTCFIASILVAEYFRRYSEWRVVTTEYPSLFSNEDMLQIPTTNTFFRSSVLMSLSGAGVMLYAMGELSQ